MAGDAACRDTVVDRIHWNEPVGIRVSRFVHRGVAGRTFSRRDDVVSVLAHCTV